MTMLLAGCDLAALSGVIAGEEDVEIPGEREGLVELGVEDLVEKHYEFLENKMIDHFTHTLNPEDFKAPSQIIPEYESENNGEFGEAEPITREEYAKEYEEKLSEGYDFAFEIRREAEDPDKTDLKAVYEAEVEMTVGTPGDEKIIFDYDVYMELHSPVDRGWHITVIEKNSK